MTLLVRDEADIVDQCLAFHLSRGVDHIVATDNGSVDRTREILESHQRAGRLTLIDEPSPGYDQVRWVTRMARHAASKLGADWVLNVDADEFWWPRGGTFQAAFAAADPSSSVVVAPLRNMVLTRAAGMRPEQFRFWRRRGAKRKVGHRGDPEVVVGMGNHEVLHGPDRLDPRTDLLTVYHLPHRSYDQFERKVRNGGEALAHSPDLPEDVCIHWRRQYEALQAGDLPEVFAREVLVGRAQLVAELARHRVSYDARLARALRALR